MPAFPTLFHTIGATYERHAGCEATSHMDGSMNRIRPVYHLLTRPGVHWSLLAELHEEIKEPIPEKQILMSSW